MSIPYTYLIKWSKTGKYYYGSQYGRNANPSNLWVKYFTSSKYVAKYREAHGEPDIIQIRKIFSCKNKCLMWENKVLKQIIKDSNCLNVSYNLGRHAICLSGQVPVITEDGKSMLVSVDHPDYLCGKLKHVRTGQTAVIDPLTGKTFSVSVNDPRFISGELLSVNKGKKMHSQLGRIWLNNGVSNKYVMPDEVDSLLSIGYKRGCIQKYPHSRNYNDRPSQKGTCWICNKHGEVKKIKLQALSEYLNLGYKRGRKWTE